MAKLAYLTKNDVKLGKSRKTAKPASFKWKVYCVILSIIVILQSIQLLYFGVF